MFDIKDIWSQEKQEPTMFDVQPDATCQNAQYFIW